WADRSPGWRAIVQAERFRRERRSARALSEPAAGGRVAPEPPRTRKARAAPAKRGPQHLPAIRENGLPNPPARDYAAAAFAPNIGRSSPAPPARLSSHNTITAFTTFHAMPFTKAAS